MTLLNARHAADRERVIAEMERRSRRYARLLSIPPRWLLPQSEAPATDGAPASMRRTALKARQVLAALI
jgi:hypothetical protein